MRVTLEVLWRRYKTGYSAEELAGTFATAGLDNVDRVLAYCLNQPASLTRFMEQVARKEAAASAEIERRSGTINGADLQARLQQRRAQ